MKDMSDILQDNAFLFGITIVGGIILGIGMHHPTMTCFYGHTSLKTWSAQTVLAKAFEDYNSSRIHSALGYLTLDEFTELWEMRHK